MSLFDDVLESGRSFFVFLIAIFIILALLDGLVTQFTASGIATTESITAVTSVKDQTYAGLDVAFLVLAIGLIAVSVLIGLLKAKDPVWFVGLVIGLVCVMFLLVILGAIYDRFISVTTIGLIISQLKYAPFVMAHLLEYAIIYATATSIAVYGGKSQT